MGEPTPPQAAVEQDPEPVAAEPADGDDQLVEEDLLIEEVSIDGMCGVY
ncbi:MAG: mycofactocin precursor MftA [Solirubrobacteraceae bacterium]